MLYKVYEYCIFIPCLSSEVGLNGFRERWLVGTGDFPIKNKYLPTLNRAPLQPGLWIQIPIVFCRIRVRICRFRLFSERPDVTFLSIFINESYNIRFSSKLTFVSKEKS